MKNLVNIIKNIMLWRLVSIFLLLAIANTNLAASFLCISAENFHCAKESLPNKETCSTTCCSQGKSLSGSIVAKVCCEVACGEQSNDLVASQSEINNQIPAPNVCITTVCLPNNFLLEKLASKNKFLDVSSFYYKSPDLYLRNSIFLI